MAGRGGAPGSGAGRGWWLLPAVAVLAFVLVIALVATARDDDESDPAARSTPTATPSPIQRDFGVLEQQHTDENIDYPQSPPVGGEHAATGAGCGIHDEPVLDEQAVHDLAVGAIWIAYPPGADEGEVEQLRALARGNPQVLLSPYPALNAHVVATAWSIQLRLPNFDLPRLEEFVDKYAGIRAVEKGTC